MPISLIARAASARPTSTMHVPSSIDFVDARTNTLVWRGWSEGNFDGVIDDQAWMEEQIDRAVIRILERLPGRM